MNVVKIPFINGEKDLDCDKSLDLVLNSLNDVFSNSRGVSSFNFNLVDLGVGVSDVYDLVYRKAFSIFDFGKGFFLGGDHSVSYSTARAFWDWSEHNSKDSVLIVFDAHPNLIKPVDSKRPKNEEWLRTLIEDGFSPKKILLVGVRNSNSNELNYLKEKGVRVMSITDLFLDYLNKVDAITEFGYSKNVYVSFDMDVLDCSCAPGVNFCEPGGFSSKEFLYIVSRIFKMPGLRGVDLVGFNSSFDFNSMTSKLGAKILAEFF